MSGPAALLRPMRWQDLTEVEALERFVNPDDAWDSASWWHELALRPRRDYTVALRAGQLVGYAGLTHSGPTADVMTMAVAPGARCRGVGSLLMHRLHVRARALGARSMLLEVRADNQAALALYDRHGYVVIARRRGYYHPGSIDALVMRASLPEATECSV